MARLFSTKHAWNKSLILLKGNLKYFHIEWWKCLQYVVLSHIAKGTLRNLNNFFSDKHTSVTCIEGGIDKIIANSPCYSFLKAHLCYWIMKFQELYMNSIITRTCCNGHYIILQPKKCHNPWNNFHSLPSLQKTLQAHPKFHLPLDDMSHHPAACVGHWITHSGHSKVKDLTLIESIIHTFHTQINSQWCLISNNTLNYSTMNILPYISFSITWRPSHKVCS